MLIDLRYLVEKYSLKPTGVLHVGAHAGQEAAVYARCGMRPVYWIESLEGVLPRLRCNVNGYAENHVIAATVSDRVGIATFNISNNEESSSLLELGTHATRHPNVHYVRQVAVLTTTVDMLLARGDIRKCGGLNIDVQGAELLVLRGAEDFLATVDWVYLEVNVDELYVGCVRLVELDLWLCKRGFERREVIMTDYGWGDGFWMRIREVD